MENLMNGIGEGGIIGLTVLIRMIGFQLRRATWI